MVRIRVESKFDSMSPAPKRDSKDPPPGGGGFCQLGSANQLGHSYVSPAGAAGEVLPVSKCHCPQQVENLVFCIKMRGAKNN